MKKRVLAIFLTFAMMAGAAPLALAEDSVSVSVDDSVAMSADTAEEPAEEAVPDTQAEGVLTGSVSAADADSTPSLMATSYASISPYASDSNKTVETGNKMNLYFTVKHTDATPESRLLFRMYTSDGTKILQFPQNITDGWANRVKYTLQLDTSKFQLNDQIVDFPIGEYTIKCSTQYKKNGAWKTVSNSTTAFQVFTTPQCTKASASKSGLMVSWNAVWYLYEQAPYEASSVSVYRKAGSAEKWTLVASDVSPAAEQWLDTNVKNGTKYTYSIKTKFNNTLSKRSSSKSYYYLNRPTTVSVSSPSQTQMKVSWKRNAKASGYQIKYSENADLSNGTSVTVSGNKTVSKTISKLSSGAQYSVRVRSYKTVKGKKYYSAWSDVVTRQ